MRASCTKTRLDCERGRNANTVYCVRFTRFSRDQITFERQTGTRAVDETSRIKKLPRPMRRVRNEPVRIGDAENRK